METHSRPATRLSCRGRKSSLLTPAAFSNPQLTRRDPWDVICPRPSFVNSDASLSKTTKLTERLGLGRLEVYNVFNHPNFSTPGEGNGGQGNEVIYTPVRRYYDSDWRARWHHRRCQLQMAAKLIF